MIACCPECDEDINVGTAGPASLSQHTGKSKCEKTKEMKKKLEKGGRTQTLFDVGMKKAKDILQQPAQPKASSSRNSLSVPLPIIPTVHPS